MGKLVTIIAILLASATTAFAEDAIDPMVWSKNQWRSDLFHTYSTHRAAPQRAATRTIVVEKTVVVEADAAQAQPSAPVARPKLIVVGGQAGEGNVSVSRPGHSCSGVLTLTWVGDHAVSTCSRNQSRVIRVGQ